MIPELSKAALVFLDLAHDGPAERPVCGAGGWDFMINKLKGLGMVDVAHVDGRVVVTLTQHGEDLRAYFKRLAARPHKGKIKALAYSDMTPEQQAMVDARYTPHNGVDSPTQDAEISDNANVKSKDLTLALAVQ